MLLLLMITENYRKQSKFTESHRRQATKSNSMWKNILVDRYWKLPKSTKSYGYRETVLLLSSFFLLLQLYQALPYLSGTLKAYFSARSKPTVFTNASHSLPPSQLANSKCVVPGFQRYLCGQANTQSFTDRQARWSQYSAPLLGAM